MDPYMKEYFINCRIPYKLGRTTRWNWERSGNVLPLFFFSRVCNQGKLGLFPNLVPGPSQCEWRFISFAAHIELITSLMYSDSHPSVIKSHFDQLQGAHRSLLNVTAGLTLAAAAFISYWWRGKNYFFKLLVNWWRCQCIFFSNTKLKLNNIIICCDPLIIVLSTFLVKQLCCFSNLSTGN